MGNKAFKTVLFLAFAALLSIPAYYFYIFSNIEAFTPEGFGQFGDYFGGVLNPVFSFFAIFLLIFSLKQQNDVLAQQSIIIEQQEASIKIQSEELKDSNEQLKLSREEMKNANTIHSEQLKIQSRELVKKDIDYHYKEMLREVGGAFQNMVSFREQSVNWHYSLSRVYQALKDKKNGKTEYLNGENIRALGFHNDQKEIKRKHLEAFRESFNNFISASLSSIEFIDSSVILDLLQFNVEKYADIAVTLEVISIIEAEKIQEIFNEEKIKSIRLNPHFHYSPTL